MRNSSVAFPLGTFGIVRVVSSVMLSLHKTVVCPNAIVSVDFANSACTAGGGQIYMWGKVKNNGDDWMYLNLQFLHKLGHAQCGELGYGPTVKRSLCSAYKGEYTRGNACVGVSSQVFTA
ncbi:hypothetical protein YC2023_096814 [Brassica napus]